MRANLVAVQISSHTKLCSLFPFSHIATTTYQWLNSITSKHENTGINITNPYSNIPIKKKNEILATKTHIQNNSNLRISYLASNICNLLVWFPWSSTHLQSTQNMVTLPGPCLGQYGAWLKRRVFGFNLEFYESNSD